MIWRFLLIYIFILFSGICVFYNDFEIDPKISDQINKNYTKSLKCLFAKPKVICE